VVSQQGVGIDLMRRDDWIDDDEYPDEDDIEAFGEDSPPDNHPLTIGYVGNSRPSFWTKGRIILLITGLVLIGAFVLPLLLPLLTS
jgi:hypothetical protein